MHYVINTTKYMDERSLCTFYTNAILPQFGINKTDVNWTGSKVVTIDDEAAYWFEVDGKQYVLIFEDYDGMGRDDAFIRNEVLTEGEAYEFVLPESDTESSPSYDGFHLPTPCMYCPYVTGTYTLLRITG